MHKSNYARFSTTRRLSYLTHWLICAQVIGAHTKVIQAFVDTSDSPFGCLALEKLFELADLDGDGTVDRDELERALKKLGFYHLSAKQIDAIMSRADEDDNCVIDYDEFVKEAPCCVEIKLYGALRHRRDDSARTRRII